MLVLNSENQKQPFNERRRNARIRSFNLVKFREASDPPQSAVVTNAHDISVSGIRFYAKLPVQYPVYLEVLIPQNHQQIQATGKIAWCGEEQVQGKTVYHVAVIFEEMDPKDQALLRTIIARQQSIAAVA